jgi:hypothetical protein
MNRKQRVLTIFALIAFVVIGWCHYLAWPPMRFDDRSNTFHFNGAYLTEKGVEGTLISYAYQKPMIQDVRMPWFMLGVIYAGLFFLLADKKEKR